MFKTSWRLSMKVMRRFYSTAEAPKPAPSKRRKPVALQMADYFRKDEHFAEHVSKISEGLLKERSAKGKSLYFMSQSAVDTTFSAIKQHLNPDVPIIEIDPGLGLLTRRLLSLSPCKILAYENDVYFKSVMDALAAENPNILDVRKAHFVKVWREVYKDKLDGGTRVEAFFPGIEKKPWESDPVTQVIGVTPNPKFYQFLVNCVAFQNGIFLLGRSEFYLAVPPEIFWHINCEAVYLPVRYSKYILFNLFFDFEVLCEIPGRSFVPWLKRSHRQLAFIKNCDVSKENYYLMKAVPKRDLFTVLPPNLLKSFWFFIYQGTQTTRNKVIPYIEKWIPGCGPLFISKGLDIFTDFRDLKNEQILDVFITFVNLPEFEDCPFHAAMDSFFFKSEDAELDDATDIATLSSADNEDTPNTRDCIV